MRMAAVAALALVVFAGGVTAGAVGSALVLGRRNDAGTRTTVINSAGNGAVLRLNQAGMGPALIVDPQAGRPAIQIQEGGIRVVGAGADTPTAAFTVTDGPTCNSGNARRIDNPLINGKPNALLFLTARTIQAADERVWVRYLTDDSFEGCSPGYWHIFGGAVTSGYNVLVITP
jgi:hypothetical protein